jgi:hypothetical protein
MRSLNPFALCALAALAACVEIPPANETEASTGSDPGSTTSTSAPPPTDTGLDLVCIPGEQRCADDGTREVCKPTGLNWEQFACGGYQKCNEVTGDDDVKQANCVGPCEMASDMPNSLGCEFVAMRMRSYNVEDNSEAPDALVVGNPDKTRTATVQLYFTPEFLNAANEMPVGDPVPLAPGEAHLYTLDSDFFPGYSALRSGGVYRVASDLPIISYLHSPLVTTGSNDSSMLLPVKSLRKEYVIASYPPRVDVKKPDAQLGRPSYFNVIALNDGTTVEWTPRADTFGNNAPIAPVPAKQTGSVIMNKFDVLQIGASSITNTLYSSHDVSGTVLKASHPIWVMGATSCASVPVGGSLSCNHLEENMLPIEYWGKQYIAAHSPVRNTEKHLWRVYAGAPNVTVILDPPPVGTQPATLTEVGQYAEFIVENGFSFTFQGTGPFLPVQYLYNFEEAGDKGDPAMYQMVPVEQFIDRYVFATGVGYDENYVQVIRKKGSAPVTVNGEEVTGYYVVNGGNGPFNLVYEVADWKLPVTAAETEPQAFLAESDDPFGIVVIGYKDDRSAYAYPGGMALRPITPE